MALALAGCALAQVFQGGSGPTVLSRGRSITDENRNLPLGFQYYAGASGTYESGLVPVSVDSSGNIPLYGSLFGVEAEIGAQGIKRTAHSAFGLSYNGNYRHYSKRTYFNGSDHVLGLEGSRDLSRRLTIVSRTSVGSIARAVGGFGNYVNTPGYEYGLPTNDIFDNRSYFLQTTDEIRFQKSMRLSFTAGGDAFGVRRQSKALAGVNGYGAHGTVAYRISRKETVDLSYTFLHFDYPRQFGESNLHQYSAGYARSLNSRFEVSLMGGAAQVDTEGVTQVALDPATAALFGQSTSISAFHKVLWVPAFGASLRGRSTRTTNFDVSYERQPSPGNGVYLTSNMQSGRASVSYTGISRLSVSMGFQYSKMGSIGQTGLGKYSTIGGSADCSYRIGRDLHAGLSYTSRQMQIDVLNGLNRIGSRAAISLRYSPGERPLGRWR